MVSVYKCQMWGKWVSIMAAGLNKGAGWWIPKIGNLHFVSLDAFISPEAAF